jgi:uncharacterized membrane protein
LAVVAQSSRSLREIALVEYPRRGIAAIGFVTGPTRGEIHARADEGPDPSRHVDREGIELVLSGGIVRPPRDGEIEALRPRPGRGRPDKPEPTRP